MPGDSSTEMSCSLRPLACSGVAEGCAEAGLIRAMLKTLKVMNARVFENDKSVLITCSLQLIYKKSVGRGERI
jgi:hypothetical protein